MCFSSAEVTLACTAGTALGEKMLAAFDTCLHQEQPAGRKGGRGKGKGKRGKGKGKRGKGKGGKGKGKGGKGKGKCPTVDQITEKLGMELADDLCILEHMGWVDQDGNNDEAAMKADLATLPTEVTAEITEDNINECVEEMLEEWEEDPMHKRSVALQGVTQ